MKWVAMAGRQMLVCEVVDWLNGLRFRLAADHVLLL